MASGDGHATGMFCDGHATGRDSERAGEHRLRVPHASVTSTGCVPAQGGTLRGRRVHLGERSRALGAVEGRVDAHRLCAMSARSPCVMGVSWGRVRVVGLVRAEGAPTLPMMVIAPASSADVADSGFSNCEAAGRSGRGCVAAHGWRRDRGGIHTSRLAMPKPCVRGVARTQKSVVRKGVSDSTGQATPRQRTPSVP
eukprot:3452694-Prymnesium_polylepis.2